MNLFSWTPPRFAFLSTFGAWALLFPTIGRAQVAGSDPAEFFEKRIRPILADNCFACHTSLHMGGLEMRSRETLLTGGKRGPAVVPGKPEESLLVRAISHQDPLLKMPPSGRLKNADIEALTAWIKAGVVWPAP